MTYPPSNPGYPAAQQFGQPQQPPAKPAAAPAADGESSLPTYLLIGVAATGLVAYILSFVGLYSATEAGGMELPAIKSIGYDIYGAVLAALLAGVSLLPKQKKMTGVVAVIATFALLSALYSLLAGSENISIVYWVVLVVLLGQTAAAIVALLFESGVMKPPAPKPQFDPQAQQYGQYGGPSQYYGQQSQPQVGAQSYQQAPAQQQRPGGYPAQSQYGAYPTGGNTGGFSTQAPQSGPPTPPTGFPAFGQPQAPGNTDDQTSIVQTQQPAPDPSSPPSGPVQS